MSFIEVGKSALLDKVLVDSSQGDSASAGYIGKGLRLVSHHDHGPLDIFNMEVVA